MVGTAGPLLVLSLTSCGAFRIPRSDPLFEELQEIAESLATRLQKSVAIDAPIFTCWFIPRIKPRQLIGIAWNRSCRNKAAAKSSPGFVHSVSRKQLRLSGFRLMKTWA